MKITVLGSGGWGTALALLLTGPGPWSVDAWCMDIVHVIFG